MQLVYGIHYTHNVYLLFRTSYYSLQQQADLQGQAGPPSNIIVPKRFVSDFTRLSRQNRAKYRLCRRRRQSSCLVRYNHHILLP